MNSIDGINEAIAHVEASIAMADSGTAKLTQRVLEIPGMSSPKVRRLLNNLCAFPKCHYLEIGTWKGSTLVSALYANEIYVESALAIDNFSEFGNARDDLAENLKQFLGAMASRLSFIEGDCWKEARKLREGDFNVYFYDGNHSELNQYRAFTQFSHLLSDMFIALVDDYNLGQVRSGTACALEDLKFEVLKEWILPASHNGDLAQWWNGLLVVVVQKPRLRL